MKKDAKRMLIIRFSALGDVAMTIPVIYSLARRYPELHIDVATRPFFSRLFINKPENVNVIGIDLKEYSGVRGTLKLLKLLSRLKPDYVADFHNVLRSWIIDNYMRLRGCKVVMLDKMRSARKELFKTGAPQPPFIDRYTDVLAKLGYETQLSFKSLYEETPAAVPFTPNGPAIGIAPFARYYTKTYPAEKMREVIRQLTVEGYNVYLFGGRGAEAEELKKWAEECERCHSVAGVYSLEEEIALMGAMDAMVSMDSSNQHMATLAGTKVLSIWGGTTPACGFMAYGQSYDTAICLDEPHLKCQPCSVGGTPECPKGHFNCMMLLSPDYIIEKIKEAVPLTK